MDNGRFTALTFSRRSVYFLLMISAAVMPESRIASTAAAGETSEVLFDRDIRPILVRTCYRCHGPDAGQRQAGLDLTSREAATKELPSRNIAIVPEHPEQ
ncbi:MAG: c-type cytochrome domain-containing protein, partial [Phycisphaerae bacterium]